MAAGFDPYYKWLGIPPEEQPPNHYRLLGLRLFESDPEVIEAASDQRMAFLRTYQTGQYSALSQKLLNEVAGAKICLISPRRRAGYDESLRSAAGLAADAPLPSSAIAPVPSIPIPSATIAAATIPLPSPESPVVPMAPPAAGDYRFDLERLGVTEDLDASTDSGSGNGTGHWNSATLRHEAVSPDMSSNRRPALAARPRHRILVALLAMCAILLSLIIVVLYFARGKRTDEMPASAGNPSSANSTANPATDPTDRSGAAKAARPSAADNAALDSAAAQNRAAAQDLRALQKYAGELSNGEPMSPLRNTRMGKSLWLHMNFERNTIVEHEKQLFVKDISGRNHHGICRQGRTVAGRVGDALECDTPLRLLFGAVNQVPEDRPKNNFRILIEGWADDIVPIR